jgi:hypothetical protein
LPDRLIWLTAVTVSGDWAAVGGAEQCCRVPPIDREGIACKRYGDHLEISLAWPAGLHEIEVQWEQRGSTPGQLVVTRTEYRERGLHIPLSGEAATVVLYPVIVLPSKRLRGPEVSVEVLPHTVADYHFSWKRRVNPFSRRRFLAGMTLTAQRDIRISRLVLVRTAGSYQPLRMTDGNVARTCTDVELLSGQPRWVPVGLSVAGPCWLTCFVPDDDVKLRDPPPDERRLK